MEVELMSDKNSIKITISGSAGTGKTAIATLLMRQLELFGFSVIYEDPDGRELPCSTTMKKRMKAIQDKGNIIDIREQQTSKGVL
jgi:CO dehydrogenase nickel-insertion accessory protein CooC1